MVKYRPINEVIFNKTDTIDEMAVLVEIDIYMENPYARVYGLTGVMGSGKSTVAKLLHELGGEILDADAIARYVIDPPSPYYLELKAKLIAMFGAESQAPLFFPDGALDRALLGRITFGDSAKVARLNSIMHPAIQSEFAARVSRIAADKLIFYDVPLLFEGGLEKRVKASILVYAPEQLCVARARARAEARGQRLTAEEARARLGAQISIEKKRALADYVIDNSGDLAALKPRVAELYRELAAQG